MNETIHVLALLAFLAKLILQLRHLRRPIRQLVSAEVDSQFLLGFEHPIVQSLIQHHTVTEDSGKRALIHRRKIRQRIGPIAQGAADVHRVSHVGCGSFEFGKPSSFIRFVKIDLMREYVGPRSLSLTLRPTSHSQ